MKRDPPQTWVCGIRGGRGATDQEDKFATSILFVMKTESILVNPI